jgi:hypothetical protein
MNDPFEALPRWNPLPGDPPDLTRWLARQREQTATYEPLPLVPDGEGP